MIRFDLVNKSYGKNRVLKDFSLAIAPGKILCLIGPSGCGKTTALQLLAGLDRPDSGKITGTEGLRVSYVFQEPRLLPWKTVADNIAFVLKDVVAPARQQELIGEYLTMMGLYEYRDTYPRALSGGMKQRLALCRSLAFPHDLLLLDEPFKSLDVPLRLNLVRQVAKMWEASRHTIVFVTHDIMDALILGHRVLVLSAGPTAVLDTVEIDTPLNRRDVSQEPFPAHYARLLALLEGESIKST